MSAKHCKAIKVRKLSGNSGEMTEMEKRKIVSQRGYSLIEIMIILVITAILTTFAVTRFGKAQTQFKRQNIARELKVNLERARFDAVKRRALAPVNIGDPDNRSKVEILSPTSFRITMDLNQNGTVADASDARTIDFTGQTDVAITGDKLDFPIIIKFDQFGRIEAKNKSAQDVTPFFTICNQNCTAAATAANADMIYVSPSGTVAMLAGGEKQPAFNSPGVTVVPVADNINPDLQRHY